MAAEAFNTAAKTYTADQRDAGRQLILECGKQQPDVGWIKLSVSKTPALLKRTAPAIRCS